MPGRDRTGPMGQGPRTGRQMGLCGNSRPRQDSQVSAPAFNMRRSFAGGAGRGPGRGCRGRGFRGRGRGLGFNQ